MGSGRWDNKTWDSYTRSASTMSRDELYSSRAAQAAYDSRKITLRESRDSADNPVSTPIILGLDVTGSMGKIAEMIAKEGLGSAIESILERKPVSDPHIMIMAIGDATSDVYPLQATQYEADNRLVDQLTSLYLEGGGGGNSFESYDIPWMFAATRTSIDSFEKRGVKGYLFTMGDEECPIKHHTKYTRSQLQKVFGGDVGELANMTSEQALENASERYHVFHFVVADGSHCRSHGVDYVVDTWTPYLGEACIVVDNYRHIPQIVVSVIQVNEGADPEEVINSWENKAIAASVSTALYYHKNKSK